MLGLPDFAVDHPSALYLGLLFALLPWGLQPQIKSLAPSLASMPTDPYSRALDISLRLLGSLAIIALSLGLAGLHVPGGQIEKMAQGAHVALVIDRSSSMNELFGQADSANDLSKAQAAKLLLHDFAQRRDKDHIAVVAFSTTPMPILPLTSHPEAIHAAINAIDHPGLSHTDIGRALQLSLNMLYTHHDPLTSRAVILVSDGAGVISREVQDTLRNSLLRQPVQLYWLFIRSSDTPSIYERPSDRRRDTPQAMPERHLHLFFESLGVPYLAFEAQSPAEVASALAQIDAQEQQSIRYTENIPRTELAQYSTGVALLCLALLSLALWLERSFTLAPPR